MTLPALIKLGGIFQDIAHGITRFIVSCTSNISVRYKFIFISSRVYRSQTKKNGNVKVWTRSGIYTIRSYFLDMFGESGCSRFFVEKWILRCDSFLVSSRRRYWSDVSSRLCRNTIDMYVVENFTIIFFGESIEKVSLVHTVLNIKISNLEFFIHIYPNNKENLIYCFLTRRQITLS